MSDKDVVSDMTAQEKETSVAEPHLDDRIQEKETSVAEPPLDIRIQEPEQAAVVSDPEKTDIEALPQDTEKSTEENAASNGFLRPQNTSDDKPKESVEVPRASWALSDDSELDASGLPTNPAINARPTVEEAPPSQAYAACHRSRAGKPNWHKRRRSRSSISASPSAGR